MIYFHLYNFGVCSTTIVSVRQGLVASAYLLLTRTLLVHEAGPSNDAHAL